MNKKIELIIQDMTRLYLTCSIPTIMISSEGQVSQVEHRWTSEEARSLYYRLVELLTYEVKLEREQMYAENLMDSRKE